MSTNGTNPPRSRKSPPRATAEDFSADVDRLARLIVEGLLPRAKERAADPEAAVCARWVETMEQRRAWHGK